MIPDISRHETTNMNAPHISIWEEEKSGGMHGTRNVAFVFVAPAAQIATAQPLNSGFSSLPVVFFPRKPLLTRFQAQACLIENNQRGLSVWGRPPYEGVGEGGSRQIGSAKMET